MAESFIQLPPDSTGKQLRTATGGPNGAHMEVHVLADSDGTLASVSTLAKDGTDATGVTAPAGGTGLRGWLSGIYQRLASASTAAAQTDGSQKTQVVSATGTALNLDSSGAVTLQSAGTPGTTAPAKALQFGGLVSTTVPTPGTSGQLAAAWFDRYGRQNIADTDAETNLTQRMTRLRDRLIAQRYTVVADSVADGLATIWTFSTTGTGVTPTVVAGSGEGTLQTSAATNSSSQMSSTVLRYLPGQVSWLNSAVRFGAATAGNRQILGPVTMSGTTPQDGFFFEQNGTTFDAVVVKAGVEVSRTPSTSWTLVTRDPFTFDSNFHQYEFAYTANSVDFLIDNVVRHRVAGSTATITATLNFPMTLANINTTNTTNVVMGVRNIGMGRYGTPPSDYSSGEILTDQAGAGGVLTFTFSTPVDFVWVEDTGTSTTNISRVNPFGGTPNASTGIPIYAQASRPVQVVPPATTVRVYAPTGSNIAMHGYRYV